MKKLYTFLSILVFITGIFVQPASADIAVTVTNRLNTTPNLNASYTTLAAALTALNAVTAMTGPVTLTLAADTSEVAPPAGFTIGSTSLNAVLSFTNQVTIVRAGGTVTLFAGVGVATPASAVPDGILKIVGADYITIDGLTFIDKNTTNPATMEFGVALFKLNAADGAQNNTIKRCTFKMQRVNNASGAGPMVDGSVAINVVNSIPTAAVTSLTPSTPAGANSYNLFYANVIHGGNNGIVLNGYAAPSPFTLGDIGNDIGGGIPANGNGIYNFGGGGTGTINPSAGIRANYQWGVIISWNTINNNLGDSGVFHTSTLRGIYAQAGTSANATITHNYVTINCGATTSSVYGIDNGIGSTASSNTINITHNKVTGTYPTATSGTFYALQNTATAAIVNITDNTIAEISTPGSGSIYALYSTGAVTLNLLRDTIRTITKTVSGTIYTLYAASSTTVTAQNNILDSISITAATSTGSIYGYYSSSTVENVNNNIVKRISSTGTGTIYGIYFSSGSGNKTVLNNQVHHINRTSGGTIYGLYLAAGSTDDISANEINNLSINAGTTGTIYGLRISAGTLNNAYLNKVSSLNITGGTTGSVYGLYVSTGTTNNVFRNKICDISSGGTSPVVYGAYLVSGTTNSFYNNMIGNLSTPAANSANPLAGIYVSGGTTNNIYDNTVYLNATSTGALFGSSALYASITPTLDMRNNILVNTSTRRGTGITAAFRRSTTALASYALTSNYNYYYAGIPSDSAVVFYDGTNIYRTLTDFQAWVTAPRDAQSVTDDSGPTFLNISCGDPNFLHISSARSVIESSGSSIAGIDNDFDNNIRQGSPGYPVQTNGGGSAPDIGADEYDGLPGYTCMTPTPGATLTTANSLCLGQTITLTLQNATAGTGVSYQWQSSPTGSGYTDIADANLPTYTTTPLSSLFYRCVVTCQNGLAFVTSTPIQITFANNITGTTPGSRCGLGTVTLAATGTTPTLNWYTAATGGSFVGTGSPFTTPEINTTTSFYVGAESFSAGGAAVGAGATTSATYSNPFYSLYSNIHTQHLITAAELTAAGLAAGNITSVALNVTAAGTLPMIDLSVKIAATAATNMSAFLTPAFTTVYTNASLMPIVGLNVLTFSPPFAWDGTSNIVLEFCHGNGASTATMSRTVKADATAYVSSIKTHATSATPSATICSNTSSNLLTYSVRPQFTFAGQILCSSPRSQVVATVTTPPDLTVTANQTVCNNEVATIGVTTALANYDTYVWSPATYLFTDPGCINAYNGTASATILYAKSAVGAATTYTCTATKVSTNCINTKQSTITVLPATPTISAFPASFCISGSTVLTLSPATGWGAATFQWQSSEDNITFTDIDGATTQNLTTKVILTTTYFKLLIKNGSGTLCSSPQITVTVNHPQITNIVPGTRCGIGTVQLAATAVGGTLNWYATPTGGTPIGTGSPFTTPVISTTTNFYAGAESYAPGNAAVGAGASTSATYSNPFYSLYSNIHTQHLITAAELAAAGLGAGNLTSVALDVTVAGTLPMINLSVKIATTTATTMSAFVSPSFSTVYNNASLMPVVGLNVLPFTTPFYWDGTSNIVLEFCHGNGSSTATMSRTCKADATPYVSSIKAHVSAATSSATICANTTSNVLTYSVRPQFTFGGQAICSDIRTTVTATVTPPPVLAITTSQAICNNEVFPITVTTGMEDFDTFTWSPADNLFTDLACNNAYQPLASATTVYVKSATGIITTYNCTATKIATGCVNMAQATFTVIPVPVITAFPVGICISGSSTMSLSPTTGYGNATFQWQESASGVAGTYTDISGATNMSFTTPTISATRYYQVVIRNGSGIICSTNQYTMQVSDPQTPVGVNGSRCGIGTVVLGASGTGGTLNWFASATGGLPLGTGPSFTTPVISSTTSYWVSTKSPASTVDYVGMAVPVNPTSGSGASTYGLYFDALSAFTLTSVNVYPNATANNTPGTVTISVLDGSGAVLHQAVVNVTGFVQSSNPTMETVNLNFNIAPATGLRLVMTSKSSGISGLMFQPSAGGPYAFPFTVPGVVSITSGTYGGVSHPELYYYFYNWQVSVGCESPRIEVIATVTPPPALYITGDQTICNNVADTINVNTTLSDFDSYTWSPTANLFTDPACNNAYVPLASATTVYVKSATGGVFPYTCTATKNSSGCVNTAVSTITILPANPAITPSPASICVSGTAVLSLSPATGWGSATYQWQDSPDGSIYTDISGATNQNYTTGTVTTTRYFKVNIKNSAGVYCTSLLSTLQVNNPETPVGTDGARCGTGTVELSATGSGTLKWYDVATGGTAIGTGTTFTTPVISATTNYWVGASYGDGGTTSVGPLSPTAQGGTIGTQTIEWGIYFTTFSPTILKSVDIFPLATGQSGVIEVRAGSSTSGTLLATINYTTTVSGGATPQTIMINHNLPVPGSYTLYTSVLPTSGISRNTSGAVYPYTSSVANITGNGYSATYYMGLYNWIFGSECVSARDMVTATVGSNCMTITGTVTNATCFGSSNGAVSTVVSGGTTPYSYTWSNLATTASITGIPAGTYTVTVTDFTSSSQVGSWTVSEPADLSLSAIVTNANCPYIQNGAIDLSVSGGTLSYGYSWSNGADSQDISSLAAGTYTVVVTDAHGCQKTASWLVGQTNEACVNLSLTESEASQVCYSATNTITLTNYTVTSTGHVTLHAGQRILLLPETKVVYQGYLLAKITSDPCLGPAAPVTIVSGTGQNDLQMSLSHAYFTLYPNPTNGNFTLVQKGEPAYSKVRIDVYSMSGEKVMTERMIGEKSHEFRFSEVPAGLYFVKVVADEYVETIKLVKTR
ncbi:MAG: T9SS type A sorting domain-containing protein [Bacteroidales bacterium]